MSHRDEVSSGCNLEDGLTRGVESKDLYVKFFLRFVDFWPTEARVRLCGVCLTRAYVPLRTGLCGRCARSARGRVKTGHSVWCVVSPVGKVCGFSYLSAKTTT